MSKILLDSKYYLDKEMSFGEEGGKFPLLLFYKRKEDDCIAGIYTALEQDGKIVRIYRGEMFESPSV